MSNRHGAFIFAAILLCGIAAPASAQSDLSIAKTAPATATAGTNITYTIAVANAGPSSAANAAWSDALPPSTTFLGLTQTGGPTFTCTGGATVSCSIASLAAGASATFNILLMIVPSTSNGTSISNTANVTSSTSDPNGANNSATASTTVNTSADLRAVKLGPSFATPGSDVSYEVDVDNSGPSAVPATVTDIPAGGTILVAGQTTGVPFTCTTTSTQLTCSTPSLAPGNGAQFTLTVHIPAAAAVGSTVVNNATISSTAPDPAPGNNTATVTTTVTTDADLSVTKTGPATTPSNTTATYAVTVANGGPITATSVTLSDVVPPGFTFASATQLTGPAFTCTPPPLGGTGTITCTIPSLFNGVTATFRFVFNVTPAVPAGTVVTNTVTVSATTTDPVPANNTSSVATTVGASIPALSPAALAALALMIAGIAVVALRR